MTELSMAFVVRNSNNEQSMALKNFAFFKTQDGVVVF